MKKVSKLSLGWELIVINVTGILVIDIGILSLISYLAGLNLTFVDIGYISLILTVCWYGWHWLWRILFMFYFRKGSY